MVILGLGSNIGDRMEYLRLAVRKISALLDDLRLSSIYESVAILPPNAPPDIDRPYLNMVISGTSRLRPQELLSEVKAIEKELGRVQRYVWGPREIDIDILAMGGIVMGTPELTIPHYGILSRDFVLLPLAEAAPAWQYPVAGPFYNMRAGEIISVKGYVLSDNLRKTGLVI